MGINKKLLTFVELSTVRAFFSSVWKKVRKFDSRLVVEIIDGTSGLGDVKESKSVKTRFVRCERTVVCGTTVACTSMHAPVFECISAGNRLSEPRRVVWSIVVCKRAPP